jgi:hypothetical protein
MATLQYSCSLDDIPNKDLRMLGINCKKGNFVYTIMGTPYGALCPDFQRLFVTGKNVYKATNNEKACMELKA